MLLNLVEVQNVSKLLNKQGFNENMFYFIKNFLSNRTIKVRVKGQHSINYEINNGIPQGFLISKRLTIIILN